MPYDEYLAERIRNYFTEQKVPFYDKNMMGGCVFMVNDKMCCGIHFDKMKKIDLLMARIGENAAIEFAEKKRLSPYGFYGLANEGLCLYRSRWI